MQNQDLIVVCPCSQFLFDPFDPPPTVDLEPSYCSVHHAFDQVRSQTWFKKRLFPQFHPTVEVLGQDQPAILSLPLSHHLEVEVADELRDDLGHLHLSHVQALTGPWAGSELTRDTS